MPKPTCLKDLHTFLGMVQYLSKFSPRISEIAEPLCDLTKKHASYVWGPEHNQAFDSIKKEIVQAPILRYHDPKKATFLQTDASIKDLALAYFKMDTPSTLQVNHFKMLNADMSP